MSDLFKQCHAKLGCMVLRLFPKVMQTILKYFVTAQGLRRKYLEKDFRFVFTENEIVLMNMLPNMDEFTIEICYKILRSENMLDEPKCKWGNFPHVSEIEIADDIQRLIKATNSIIEINSDEVSEHYAEKLLEEIKLFVTRIDSYLEQGTLGGLYNSLCTSENDSISVLQELTKVTAIEEFLTNTESRKIEMYSRLAIPIIETFPKILRDFIRQKMPVANLLYKECVPILETLYPEQQTHIKELQHSNTYDSLDVTLIYQLLRRLNLVSPPTKGWGSCPDKGDTNLGDDVERIRCYRNKLAHRSTTKIEQNEFNEYFDEFRGIGYRMDLNISKTTNYEQQIIGYRTCGMDSAMQSKFENAMKEIANIKLRSEKRPIKFYWGDDFETWLTNLRSLLRDEKLEGRQKVRVKIIFQTMDDVESNIKVLNSLTEEINEGLSGIELIVATEGSLVLIVDILLEMLVTEDKLITTLVLFLKKILARITTFTSETIDIVLLPEEESTQWNKPKSMGQQVYLEFDIEAQLLENDDIMVEQLKKISDAIMKHFNGSGTNQNITATLLPINLGKIPTKENSFNQAQSAVSYNLPVSVTLRQQLNIHQSLKEDRMIKHVKSSIKIGKQLVFANYHINRLSICNIDGTNMHHVSLSNKPCFITEVDNERVAVSCEDSVILVINISTGSVKSEIVLTNICSGLSYYDNNLYVVIDTSIIQKMDLTGKEKRDIHVALPSDHIHDITVDVDRDRLVCIDQTSIYCYSLDGTHIWTFKNEKFQDLFCVTTDDEGDLYVTDDRTHTVVVVSDDGKHFRELLTASDGLVKPCGIYFDKKENILLVCNLEDGKAFLFDVKKNLHK